MRFYIVQGGVAEFGINDPLRFKVLLKNFART